MRYACLAGQPDFSANRRVGFFVVHNLEVLVCSSRAFLYQALRRVSEGYFAGIGDSPGVEDPAMGLVS
jgi:hypothetical protein